MVLFVTILQLLCGLAVILAVLFQSKLAKATKWIGAVFIVLTLILNVLH